MAVAQTQRVICDSSALNDGGPGVRFHVDRRGARAAAFVVRYGDEVYAYLNSCAHIPVELDWMEGEFYDKAGLYLICATHGATYEPDTGHCIMGPCKGQKLVAVKVEERGGKIYLTEREDSDG
jgi:nitrite reductase/ring-hydroxylating ferredoxin subunit